jgi:transposase
MPAGRPTKLTPELQKQVCDSIRKGNYHTVAAKVAGISVKTLRNWLTHGKKFPHGIYGEFRDALLRAEGEAEETIVPEIRSSPDLNDKKWWLERKHPHRWGRDRLRVRELEKRVAELEAAMSDHEPDDDDCTS